MINLFEAEQIVSRAHVYPEIEKVTLAECTGRILAEDIISPLYMPPFHKSAMDGYAVNNKDTSSEYTVIQIIPAGVVPQKKIKKGECAKIMTGAMVPEGADRVVKKEITEETKGVMRITDRDPHANICFMGEDVKKGDKVLSSGILIRPQETAVLASMGKAKIDVFKAPRVGIIATGSELVEPGQILGPGQIYNSNAYSLSAQAGKTGSQVVIHGVAVDEEKEISRAVASLSETCDMVLLSGGVSMGDYDLVPGILKKLQVNISFEKIAVKPGKPTLFGTKGKKFFFGVPGNPVSTFVIFEILIKPLLYKMMGHNLCPLIIKGILADPVKRKHTARSAFIPVLYEDGMVKVLTYHGSAHIHALTQANGLINIKRGVDNIPAGCTIDVRSI